MYRGGKKKLMLINSSMGFSDILNRVYEIVDCDRTSVEIKLFVRFPVTWKFVLVPFDDDDDLGAMWVTVSQTSIKVMEVYVEQAQKEINVEDNVTMQVPKLTPSVPLGSSTSMLCDANNVNGHIATAPSPQIVNQSNIPSSTYQLSTLNQNDINFLDHGEDHMDSDAEENEDAREAAQKAIRESAPSQDWLKIDEVDQKLIDSWMTWRSNNCMTLASEFEVGQEFDSLNQLKHFVKEWSILRNHNFKVLESEPTRYVIKCIRADECQCPWRLRAVLTLESSFKIVQYGGCHAGNCVGNINSTDHPLLSSDYVANLIEDFIRADPGFKVQSIVCFVKNQYKFSITYKRAWMAKQKALKNISGSCL